MKAANFLVGEAAAIFFFLLNIPDLGIDQDKPAFDIYEPKSRLIIVSVRSSSASSVTLWFYSVTPGFDYSATNINRRDAEVAETEIDQEIFVVSILSIQDMTAVPFSIRTPPAPPSLTTGRPEAPAAGLDAASNASGFISSVPQA